MVIVSGRIFVSPERREVPCGLPLGDAGGSPSTRLRDFVVGADPLEPGRVNVHEEWDSEAELEAFRGAGPEPELAADILDAAVTRHRVVASGLA
jgi:hypothetical protein